MHFVWHLDQITGPIFSVYPQEPFTRKTSERYNGKNNLSNEVWAYGSDYHKVGLCEANENKKLFAFVLIVTEYLHDSFKTYKTGLLAS